MTSITKWNRPSEDMKPPLVKGDARMKRPYQFKAQCLVCNHIGTVLHESKEDYQEVSVCPKCKGAYVDTWKIVKYSNNDKSATDKGTIRGITIEVGVDTDKMQLKLRAIAKHTEALANELDTIDNAWRCPNCDESNYDDYFAEKVFKHRVCNACNILYDGQDITADELPTRLEGSD